MLSNPSQNKGRGKCILLVMLNIMYQFHWGSVALMCLGTEIWRLPRSFAVPDRNCPPLTKSHSSPVFCEDFARVKKTLQHSCTEMELFFIPPASIQVVREVGTSLSGVQRAGKLGLGGWKSEGKEDEYQTKSVVWARNEGRRRTSYYKGMGWDSVDQVLSV